ncbi:MAG: TlyA family RNA methyltransferase [Myxococcales bacterium]|nr:TlyA family RNA methyltransferase [Myxococcales bacterium]
MLLVERGLAESREKARAIVMAGEVFSGEVRVDKAGAQLAEDAPLEVRSDPNPYVSRGGLKLAGALDVFAFDPTALVAADIGASTGGFTDVLLQRGATRVYAIDVGRGQLHGKLRSDPRVVVMERTNARHLQADSLPEAVDLVVIDASFIGLEKLLGGVCAILKPGGAVVALVKPQFEVGRERVGKGGVVRDPNARRDAIDAVRAATERAGFVVRGECDSSIRGPQGNLEAFLWLEFQGPREEKSE